MVTSFPGVVTGICSLFVRDEHADVKVGWVRTNRIVSFNYSININ